MLIILWKVYSSIIHMCLLVVFKFTVHKTCDIKLLVCICFVSAALTAKTGSKVAKPGFGFDWKTGGPLYKT